MSLTGTEGEVTAVEIDPGVAQLGCPAITSQSVGFLMGEMRKLMLRVPQSDANDLAMLPAARTWANDE